MTPEGMANLLVRLIDPDLPEEDLVADVMRMPVNTLRDALVCVAGYCSIHVQEEAAREERPLVAHLDTLRHEFTHRLEAVERGEYA